MRSRKLSTAIVVALTCTLYSTVAFAATGLNAQEQAILTQLKAGVTVGGTTYNIPAEYINQAETEFMKDGVDVTGDQAGVISANIAEAAAVMQKAGVTDPKALSAADQKAIMAAVQEAAAAMDYKVSIDTAASPVTVTVIGESGSTVFSNKNVINQTGYDLNATVAVIAFLAVVAAASVTVASKKKLFVGQTEA
ncbi:hypothetical protein [Anaerobium acetethylicum]|uniref:Uncharacterized protein n=1 Tax=Anaerobium acetethylicum TaxID=1619234 RepID=A0A1D3TRC8_9FIRM|nr:hypothetical protein [Anaerobium acetethylicum]SCP96253.1 hypothetical protein SAMN05421730_100444 [Anaerobium acetethylicum]